ncbi:hypothetical protein MKX01_033446, partial [Papaver californicum]
MAISSEGHSSFGTQANALLLKNLTSVPRPEFRAVKNDLTPISDFVFFVTGLNQTLGLSNSLPLCLN